ncbi:hypothetical protein QZH41_009383, partial [Actinostola sp. cb2023]
MKTRNVKYEYTGSEETFVTTVISNDMRMNAEGAIATMSIKVLGGEEQRKKAKRVSFKLAPIDTESGQVVYIEAWTINKVCAPFTAVDIDVNEFKHLRNLKLADTLPREEAQVDVIIGADQYYKIVQGNIKKGPPGTPIATRSRLGWLISGPIPGTEKDENFTSMVTVTKIDRVQEDLQRFWELDTMGIVERTMNKLSKKMMHYDSLKNHVMAPLYELEKEGKKWKEEQSSAFSEVKGLLSSETLLAHYDPNSQLYLTCDASAYGLGAVLEQEVEAGVLKPVSFASRTLTVHEKNYCQTEKEGLEVVWAV